MAKVRPTVAEQAQAVECAAEAARHDRDMAVARTASLIAAATTLRWLATHASALRALARDAQRLQALPGIAAILETFPGAEIVEVETCRTRD